VTHWLAPSRARSRVLEARAPAVGDRRRVRRRLDRVRHPPRFAPASRRRSCSRRSRRSSSSAPGTARWSCWRCCAGARARFGARRERRRRDAAVALALVGLATFAKGLVAPVLFATTALPSSPGSDLGGDRLLTPAAIAAFVVLAAAGTRSLRRLGRRVRPPAPRRPLSPNLAGGMVEGHAYSPEPLWYHLTFYLAALAIAPRTPRSRWRSSDCANGLASPSSGSRADVAPSSCYAGRVEAGTTSLPSCRRSRCSRRCSRRTWRPGRSPGRPTPACSRWRRRAAAGGTAVWAARPSGPAVALRPGADRRLLAAVPGHAVTGGCGRAHRRNGRRDALRLLGLPSSGRSPSGGSSSAVPPSMPPRRRTSLRTLARGAGRASWPAQPFSTGRRSGASSSMGRSRRRARRRADHARPGPGPHWRHDRLARPARRRALAGEGQIGNLDRGALVLTTGRRKTP
jgi:hypothetical protein